LLRTKGSAQETWPLKGGKSLDKDTMGVFRKFSSEEEVLEEKRKIVLSPLERVDQAVKVPNLREKRHSPSGKALVPLSDSNGPPFQRVSFEMVRSANLGVRK